MGADLPDSLIEQWRACASPLAAFDAAGRCGLVVLLTLDGRRGERRYGGLVSRGRPEERAAETRGESLSAVVQAVAEEVAKDLQTEIEPALRQQWMELAPLLGKLDGLVRDDIVALLKVDGLRTNGKPYTVAVSGGPLGEDFFRRDSTALAPSLLAALEFIENRSSAR